MNNPFRYGRIVEDAFFCPRPALQKQLQGYMRSAQNASIQGERRMGKTSLVLAAANGVKGFRTLHADLLGIRTAGDFCRRIVSAASRLDAGGTFLQKTFRILSGLRPTLKIDATLDSFVEWCDAIHAGAKDPPTPELATF